MRKFKSVLGSGYQETVSIEEIQQVLQDVSRRYHTIVIRGFTQTVVLGGHGVVPTQC